MLQLKGIKKDYVTGDTTVHALKGIDLTFRDSEFVSILGPSGCGKTTMLNIIGGLDHYSDGELFIDGISTKNYTDRDWDTYRNHRIGFVFQSYNLIPHQTISENVELALAISGIDKNERVKRAHEALDKVGLKGLYHKKPNQLSGGQCQRVAIARALVNDPEILLADEPTGALDTVTSVQIMELIKEISKDCLVIMVTHNPELAERYSTRIIRLLDGEVQSDTVPCNGKEEREKARRERKKKPSKKSKLSLLSTFRLSARNLRSKMKRTLLVCLAGAIGIIGVASVLSVSTGVRNYINDMQNDMLSGNPITIDEETMNLSVLMSGADRATGQEAVKQAVENGYINVDS
ncbi:MAG: ABC transporter ATP-binding protein, partial [Christensenellales bacterium]